MGTVKIDPKLYGKLIERASQSGATVEEIVNRALLAFLNGEARKTAGA